jgi:hypothetical protein
MTYDRDLRWTRRAALATIVLNTICALGNLSTGNWRIFFCSLLWASCGFVWLGHIECEQRTRDCVRDWDEAVRGWKESLEE